jgi:hypothetical protein
MLYRIDLRPLADDVPPATRLRALLKTALRRDRLRCVAAVQLPDGPPPGATTAATSGPAPADDRADG